MADHVSLIEFIEHPISYENRQEIILGPEDLQAIVDGLERLNSEPSFRGCADELLETLHEFLHGMSAEGRDKAKFDALYPDCEHCLREGA